MIRFQRRIILAIILLVSVNIVAKAQKTEISGIVNSYAKITGIDYCGRNITVESSDGFFAGDKALIIQMKGAVSEMTSADSALFGRISDYGEAGNFEFVNIESVIDKSIRIREILSRNYSVAGAVQIIKIPRYVTAVVKGELTCQPWNGSTGGVLVLEASGAIDLLNGSVNTIGKGFRGGRANAKRTTQSGVLDFNASYESGRSGEKGESITDYSTEFRAGRAALANGGGGGNGLGAGGGGGANGGAGGNGAAEYKKAGGMRVGGLGGHDLMFVKGLPRAFMGGGGGGGNYSAGAASNGGAGGGIAILKTNVFVGRGNSIYADGANAENSENDGAGGGGAGGSIIIIADVFTSYPAAYARGGNGGNSISAEQYGAGGGGGGGIICFSSTAADDSIHAQLSGGGAGISAAANNSLDASPGAAGAIHRGCVAPWNPVAGLSAGVFTDTTVCSGAAVHLDATPIGGRPPYSYHWEPASIISNPNSKATISYPSDATEYRVTITDSLGCKTEGKFIARIFDAPKVWAGQDASMCAGGSVTLRGGGEGIFRWSPTTGLSDPNSLTTIAAPSQTTVYTLTLIDNNGCSASDSVIVAVYQPPTVALPASASVCIGKSTAITAIASGGKAPYAYTWSPNGGNSATITVSPLVPTRYEVTARDANGCEATASIMVNIAPTPIADAGPDITLCAGDTTRIRGFGGVKRRWFPDYGLSNTNDDNPMVFPTQTTQYILTVESAEGCLGYDTVTAIVIEPPSKPTITVVDDTLFSSNAYTYQWLYDGVSLPGAALPYYVAQQPGKYSVRISSIEGCYATSDPVDIVIGRATLCIDSYEGSPGSIVTIGLRLCEPEFIIESGVREIETSILFNSSLLLPLDDFYLENRTEYGVRFLRLRVPINPNNPSNLISMRFKVGLGDDTVSSIRLIDYSTIGGKVLLSGKPGIFYLTGYCAEGGARLWRSGVATELLSTSPQPAEDVIRVNYQLSAASPVEWTLSDYLGRRVFVQSLPQQQAGLNFATFQLNDVPRGVYQLRLTAGSESSSLPVILR